MSTSGGSDVSLSIVVPAYNEASRIDASLRAIAAELAPWPTAEIVVCDDGSSDETATEVRKASRGLTVPVTLIQDSQNHGKGHALKLGVAATRGEKILFTDADLSAPIHQLARLLAPLDEGADVTAGSRARSGAETRAAQPWYRIALGKIFTGLVNLMLVETTDATCGFKAFRGDVGREIFARLRADRWEYDAELLVVAKHLGARVVEVAVEWEHRDDSKVQPFFDGLSSGLGLLRIWLRDRGGVYATRKESQAEVSRWSNRDRAA